MGKADEEKGNSSRGYAVLIAAILTLIPWATYLWIGSYNRVQPTLFGITFFYWYQTVWLAISAVLLAVAAALIYRSEER